MSSDLGKSRLKVTNLQVLRVYWQHIKRYPWLWGGLFFVILVAKGTDVFIPIIDKKLIDAAAASLALPDRPDRKSVV